MTMYAEERQQAMAQLVGRARPGLGRRAGRRVRRHHRDRAPRPLHARAHGPGPPGARRRRARRRLAVDRVRARRARPGQHRAEGADRPRRARPAAARRLHDRSSTPAPRPPAGQPAPPRPRASPSSPTPCRSPPGSPASPQIELHLLPGRVRPTTQAAVGADTVAALADLRADVAFLGTNGITVDHGLTTPDRDEAATKRAMVASARRSRRARRRHQDRRRVAAPLRHARRDRRAGHRRRASATHDRRALDRSRPRGGGRMIVTLTPNPSHDRTVTLPAPSSAAPSSAPSR